MSRSCSYFCYPAKLCLFTNPVGRIRKFILPKLAKFISAKPQIKRYVSIMLQLYICWVSSFYFSLVTTLCLLRLGFRHKHHLVRIRKMSWFGLKSLFCLRLPRGRQRSDFTRDPAPSRLLFTVDAAYEGQNPPKTKTCLIHDVSAH